MISVYLLLDCLQVTRGESDILKLRLIRWIGVSPDNCYSGRRFLRRDAVWPDKI